MRTQTVPKLKCYEEKNKVMVNPMERGLWANCFETNNNKLKNKMGLHIFLNES